jgi:hypothetical protein
MAKHTRRFLLRPAAEYIAVQIQTPYSPRTLEATDVPYRIVNGRRQYDQPDLDALATRILTGPRRMSLRGRRYAVRAESRLPPPQNELPARLGDPNIGETSVQIGHAGRPPISSNP